MGRCFSCCFVFRSAQRALSRYPFAAGSAPAVAGLPGPLGGGRAWGLSKEFRASEGTFIGGDVVSFIALCPASHIVPSLDTRAPLDLPLSVGRGARLPRLARGPRLDASTHNSLHGVLGWEREDRSRIRAGGDVTVVDEGETS